MAVRSVLAVWLLVLFAILTSNSYWWGWLLLVPVAFNFYLMYRLARSPRGGA